MSERADLGGARVLFHVGVHKTATTWLQRVGFPAHPQLLPVVGADPRADPFLDRVIRVTERSFDAAAARRALAHRCARDGRVTVVSAERLSGHIASGGYDALAIADRLAAAVPEASILLFTRDRSARLESEYRQLVGEGYPGRLDDLRNGTQWKLPGFDDRYFDDDALVARYRARFGSERVGTWAYEDFRADRRQVLDAISAWLGIGPWPVTDRELARVVHPGLPDRAVPVVRALNRVRRTELNPFPVVNLGSWWRGPLARLMRDRSAQAD